MECAQHVPPGLTDKIETCNGMAAARTRPLSGMQKSVLALYRSFLRAVQTKPVEQRENLARHIRSQFEANRSIPRIKIDRIEHLMRQGHKRLRMVQEPGFTGVVGTVSPSTSTRQGTS